MDSLNLPCAPSRGGGSHQGALSLGASSVSGKRTGLGHLQTHLHSVCTTRDTPMPSLSWGLLQGSGLATLIFSNFSLNPGKQGAISTPTGLPSAAVSLGQMVHSSRHQNVVLGSVLISASPWGHVPGLRHSC